MRRLSIAALAAPALAALGGCREHEGHLPSRPVLTAVARPAVRQDVGPFAGTVQPRFTTTEGFRTAGRLLSRDAEVGDLVAKGQRLATVDPTQQKLAIVAATAGVASAEAALADARAQYERTKTLFDRGVDPQVRLDQATQRRDTAGAQVEQAKALLSKAEQALGYTDLDADFAGVVLRWRSEVGQQVAIGQGVVDIARTDVLEAEINVPPAIAVAITAGTRFIVRLQSAPTIECSGRLRERTPGADTQTRAERLRIALDAKPDVFRIGSTVSVAIVPTAPPAALIPASAIFDRGKKSFVWLAEDGRVPRLTEVAIERRGGRDGHAGRDGDVTVGGLAPGARVVRAGVHVLDPALPLRFGDDP